MEYEIRPFYEDDVVGTFEVETDKDRTVFHNGNATMKYNKKAQTIEISGGTIGKMVECHFLKLSGFRVRDKKTLFKKISEIPCNNDKRIVDLQELKKNINDFY